MTAGANPAVLPALDPAPPAVPGVRLGIDQPLGCWPTAPRLKAYEAAGFSHVQVRMPPREMLDELSIVTAHAGALREVVALTGLRLILHAPDDLLAGDARHDRQLDGALTYAALAGAGLVIYHGHRVAIDAAGVRSRLADETISLRRALRRAERLGVRLAIENLAPVYPCPPAPEYVCHDPAAIAALVRRLDSEHAGMCLDIGHAHIAAELAGVPLTELIEPVLQDVIVFHVHDNFGARAAAQCAGQVEPARLDLHLAPGAGSIPWAALSPVLARHRAPLQLEVHPAGRPAPGTLAVLTREILASR
jgi:sugar phosphate isomerase/epimerase